MKREKILNVVPYRTDERLTITDISWERAFILFTIVSECDEPVEFSLGRATFFRSTLKFDGTYEGDTTDIPMNLLEEVPITPVETDGNTFKFRINMTTASGKTFLNNGGWFFFAHLKSEEAITMIRTTYEIGYKLNDLDKVFSYGKGKYAYVVKFSTQCFDSKNIIPKLSAKFMIENLEWQDNYVVRERRTPKGKVRCLIKKCKVNVLRLLYSIVFHLSRHDGKHVLLMSETRPYLWGNLKYIDNRIRERGLDKELTVSHSFRLAVGKNNSAFSWFKTIRTLAKQDFIFVDDYAPIFGFLDLNPHTKLIQVWHAGEGFKSVGFTRFGRKGSPHASGSCHKKYDYAVVGSKHLAEVYSEVFAQPMEHMLPLGMARLDGFLDEDVIKEKTDEFYAEHPELKEKKIILFCPTFRGSSQKQAYYNYDRLDLKKIYDFCGDEYVWAFKMHPFVKKKPSIPKEFSDRIIDLTPSKNINDLYYVTDIMITDYSSAYFEYSLLKRPVLFFTYDRELYEITRGVHKPILETAPGKVCDTFDDLMKALESKDYDIEKTIRFREENFGEYDGKAADRIIDTIILQSEQ